MPQQSCKSAPAGRAGTNIRVFVRVRPFKEGEDKDRSCIASICERTISVKDRDAKQPHSFTFDEVFDPAATQEQVYNSVAPAIVDEALQGVNGTIFCYGQTSSGKTHTCLGPDFSSQDSAGILPRLIRQAFSRIEACPKNIEVKMKISIVEIYNEKIRDLLDLSKADLKIRSNKKQGIFLENLTEKYILAEEEAFAYLAAGVNNRSVNATLMNSQSSRSHMVCIIQLHTHDIYSGLAKGAKIIIVDLAGSEKISKTGAEGKVLEEAKKINTSLTALGKVINTLSEGKSTHVPYRDSKLTRLLQESLGGNSLTSLIVNVSPSSSNQSETLTSIRFGQRAKSIKNEPVINKTYTIEELVLLLKRAEETIQRQNTLIQDLSKKKRSGGYGALSVPRMITMHVIGDDDLSDRSLDIEQSQTFINDEDNEWGSRSSFGTLQSENVTLKSSHKLQIKKDPENVRQIKFSDTCQLPKSRKNIKPRTTRDLSSIKFDEDAEDPNKAPVQSCKPTQIASNFTQGQSPEEGRPFEYFDQSQDKQNARNYGLSTGVSDVFQMPRYSGETASKNIPCKCDQPLKIDMQAGSVLSYDSYAVTDSNIGKIRQNLFEIKNGIQLKIKKNMIVTEGQDLSRPALESPTRTAQKERLDLGLQLSI